MSLSDFRNGFDFVKFRHFQNIREAGAGPELVPLALPGGGSERKLLLYNPGQFAVLDLTLRGGLAGEGGDPAPGGGSAEVLLREGEQPEGARGPGHVIGGARVEPPVRLAGSEGPLGVHRPEGRPRVTGQE